jgi:hypothetical protein
MTFAIIAFVCVLCALVGVLEPAMWRSVLAVLSFACGVTTVAAIYERSRP